MAPRLRGSDITDKQVYLASESERRAAPLRLVVPWTYGFKSIKSIVKITFVQKQPTSSWQRAYAQAYGFYANVNPSVPHPNWSQTTDPAIRLPV